MDKDQVEAKILDLIKQIIEVSKAYNSNTNYLNMGLYLKDNYVDFSNMFWEDDYNCPINYMGKIYKHKNEEEDIIE